MDTNPHPAGAARAASVDRLQECLRSELSAVATYAVALASAVLVGLHRSLHEILMSHVRRMAQLEQRLQHLGVEPVRSAAPWGAFVRAVGAGRKGGRAALTALQDGEHRGVALYAANFAACDLWTRTLLTADFLPEQQRTHDLCWTLQRYVEEPS